MPTFLPMIPVTISRSSKWQVASRECQVAGSHSPLSLLVTRDSLLATRSSSLPAVLPERLDLDVDAGRQVELHQRVHRLRGWLEDVDQALVCADLELLA